MEDPSLQVRYDNELGQTIIGAMGELHIEVIRDRFQRDYGLNVLSVHCRFIDPSFVQLLKNKKWILE